MRARCRWRPDLFAAVAVTDILERLDLVEVDHRDPELIKADHGP
jgi:hypothetical protein